MCMSYLCVADNWGYGIGENVQGEKLEWPRKKAHDQSLRTTFTGRVKEWAQKRDKWQGKYEEKPEERCLMEAKGWECFKK